MSDRSAPCIKSHSFQIESMLQFQNTAEDNTDSQNNGQNRNHKFRFHTNKNTDADNHQSFDQIIIARCQFLPQKITDQEKRTIMITRIPITLATVTSVSPASTIKQARRSAGPLHRQSPVLSSSHTFITLNILLLFFARIFLLIIIKHL